MGLMGAVIGGGLLGLGAAALGKKNKGGAISFSSAQSEQLATRPDPPDVPVPADPGAATDTTQNAGMEAEREREYRAAELRRQQAQEVFTSGLGAAGQAATAKKSLLGG